MTRMTPVKYIEINKNAPGDGAATPHATRGVRPTTNTQKETALTNHTAWTDPFGRIWDDVNWDGRGFNEYILHQSPTIRPTQETWVEVTTYRRHFSDGETEEVINIEANSAELNADQALQLIANLQRGLDALPIGGDTD